MPAIPAFLTTPYQCVLDGCGRTDFDMQRGYTQHSKFCKKKTPKERKHLMQDIADKLCHRNIKEEVHRRINPMVRDLNILLSTFADLVHIGT